MRLRCWLEIFDQPKLIAAVHSLVLNPIHALPNKVKTQTTRLDFVETAAAQFRGIDSGTLITEQNLKTVGGLGGARRYSFAIELDGLIGASVIAMPHDVGKSFVDRTGNRAAIGRRKAQDLGKAFEGSAYDIEQLRVTMQL